MASSFRAHPPALAAALLIAVAAPTPAQPPSLVEAARAEQARRASIAEKSRVYTNDDLGGGPRLTTAVAPPTAVEAAPADGSEQAADGSEQVNDAGAAPAPGGAAAAQSPADPAAGGGIAATGPAAATGPGAATRDAAHWRGRFTAAVEAKRRAELVAAALQNRVDGLLAEFTARDDPAQRARIEQDRRDALSELERAQAEIDRLAQEVADVREAARRAGVPPGWLR